MKLVEKDHHLKEYFDFLKNDLFALRVEWRLYRSFFGSNEETVNLLNKVSGPTASTLHRILFERTLLGLRKLTDEPLDRGGKKIVSVSVRGLSNFIQGDAKLVSLIEEAATSVDFARNWSNKRIAHSDLRTKQQVAPIKGASRLKVENAFDKIAEVIKFVSLEYFDTHQITNPLPPLGDERKFLKVMFFGQRLIEKYEEEKRIALEAQDYERIGEVRKLLQDFPDWLMRDDPPLE